MNENETPSDSDLGKRYGDLRADVRSCIARVLNVTPDVVTSNATLLDLGAQSSDFLHLVFRLEKMFHVHISKELAIPAPYGLETYCAAVEGALKSRENGS
jgi:acyl carrier protein